MANKQVVYPSFSHTPQSCLPPKMLSNHCLCNSQEKLETMVMENTILRAKQDALWSM